MKHTRLQPAILFLFLAVILLAVSLTLEAHGQPVGGQEVCTRTPAGQDVFSIGEVRTSILPLTTFQELNGPEWVLMDGQPLMVQTALSAHLALESNYNRLRIPDARGRFLRMANNNACADLRGNEEAYGRCIGRHDPDGDRVLGRYQEASFGSHNHGGEHDHGYNDIYFSESGGPIDMGHTYGTGARSDYDNRGYGWDRRTERSGGTELRGGNETRPRNITVNYYIKICNCRTENCK